MRDKIIVPEGQVHLQDLKRFRQQGMEVRAFGQKFWIRAERLYCQGMDLKYISNLCLDEPLLHWDMELVKSFGFLELLQVLAALQGGKGNSQPPESTCRGCPVPTSFN